MHLMTAQQGQIDFGDEAVDLDQSPADIVILTSTDTEILGLARANQKCSGASSRLRLANLSKLKHNYSVDVYGEKTLSKARLIVVRLLGGESYWSYGVEECLRLARADNIPIAFMPGCANPDDDLIGLSSLPEALVRFIWQRLIEGGSDNYTRCLNLLMLIVDQGAEIALSQLDDFVGFQLPPMGYWDWRNGSCQSLSDLRFDKAENLQFVPMIFYRALVNADDLAPIKALAKALAQRGLTPVPIFLTSPKDPMCQKSISDFFGRYPPAIIVTMTAFTHGQFGDAIKAGFCGSNAPMLQAILSTRSREVWADDVRGLTPRELAMYVALPEIDGRIKGGVISFKAENAWDDHVQTSLIAHKEEPALVELFADKVLAWIKLKSSPREKRCLAFILSRYPGHDGGIAHGVGLDSPASLAVMLEHLSKQGYSTSGAPRSGDEAFALLRSLDAQEQGVRLPIKDYQALSATLPPSIIAETERVWGNVRDDQAFDASSDSLHLPLVHCGSQLIALQPERTSNANSETYHDLGLPPPHAYLAFYLYLTKQSGVQAIVHLGKHGTLEWLPGKAMALSQACTPQALLGALPVIYPFIVNDPGEGCQAKRRTSAVIIDHLTPPLRQSDTYDDLAELERLVDEYYEASGSDPRRMPALSQAIMDLTRNSGLADDCGLMANEEGTSALQKIDNFLCDLKTLQIRDGLHCFGCAPKPEARTALLSAFCRAPRGFGKHGQASLLRALADDLKLLGYDPLAPLNLEPWQGIKPKILDDLLARPWRHDGDTRERLEKLALMLIGGEMDVPPDWIATQAVFKHLQQDIIPALDSSPKQELEAVSRALDGLFVAPGPSGAPTRGRIDVLPTGRNFYAIDTRAVPTPAAFRLGEVAAERLVTLYRQDHGAWPQRIGLTAWGTANMRTGGDDIAIALALIGVTPTWDAGSFRLTGFTVKDLAEMGRPRVDIIMRLSGFFRDAFPEQIALLNSALAAVAERDEPPDANPLKNKDNDQALLPRLYTNAEGAYGGGIKAKTLADHWQDSDNLAEAFIEAGGHTFEADGSIIERKESFRELLAGVDALSLTQDSREFDLLDSDDFFDFEGGLAAAARSAGAKPALYHGDSALGDEPHYRPLKDELSLIVRGRAAHPAWIAGMKNHGGRGAFEMARAVHALYGFAATTPATTSSHFDALFDAYIVDEATRNFILENNPEAYQGLIKRFAMAYKRGFWQTRSNSALALIGEFIT